MKLKLLSALAIGVMLITSSCASAEKETADGGTTSPVNGAEEKNEPVLMYVHENTEVNWTAFKTTELIGVSGVFKETVVSGTSEATSPLEVIKNASISIPIAGVFSKNPERDERIKNFFFGAMADTDSLTGTVKEVGEDGAGILSLTMNGVTGDVPVKIEVDGLNLSFSSTFSLNEWKAQDAVKALNEECGALHAGSDGVSFLSPDVKVEIKTKLQEK